MNRKSEIYAEAEYKLKSGTAWSHNYLNQKPWHPLSYPNQRRKWIAEQKAKQKEVRATEIAKEFAQEQDLMRQTAMLSRRDKEKIEEMQALSFMYAKPPGYNPENDSVQSKTQNEDESSSKNDRTEEKGSKDKKSIAKDVFGKKIATEKEFPQLANAPREDTGIVGRVRPFGIEIKNVKCFKCGKVGHQIGDRECEMKNVLSEYEISKIKREDPLSLILANTSQEPLKWELKNQPGNLSPRGGYTINDDNQKILAEADEYLDDEYGGFLGDVNRENLGIDPDMLLTSLKKLSKKEKRKRERKEKEKRKDKEEQHKKVKDRSSKRKRVGEKIEDDSEKKEKKKRRREKLEHEYNETEVGMEKKERSEKKREMKDEKEERRSSRKERKKANEDDERREKGNGRRKNVDLIEDGGQGRDKLEGKGERKVHDELEQRDRRSNAADKVKHGERNISEKVSKTDHHKSDRHRSKSRSERRDEPSSYERYKGSCHRKKGNGRKSKSSTSSSSDSSSDSSSANHTSRSCDSPGPHKHAEHSGTKRHRD